VFVRGVLWGVWGGVLAVRVCVGVGGVVICRCLCVCRPVDLFTDTYSI